MKLRKLKKVQKKQPKKLLKNRCTFYYNHLDVNQKKDKNSKNNNNKELEDDEKDYYKKICKTHLEKKGKKKYWSNISRYGDNDNNLI